MRKQSYDNVRSLLTVVKNNTAHLAGLVWNEVLAWLPQDAKRRKQVLLSLGALPIMGAVAAFATAPSNPGIDLPGRAVTEALVLDIQPEDIMQAQPLVAEERIRRGDSVANLLGRFGIAETAELTQFIRSNKDARRLQALVPGRLVSIQLDEKGRMQWLRYWLSTQADAANSDVLLIQRVKGQLQAKIEHVAFERQIEVRAGEIKSSLYGATDAADVPDAIANKMAEVFSSEIDFHRELKKGDRFRVIYENLRVNGESVRPGRLLAAEFTNDGETHRAYWYSDAKNQGGYYSAEGKSLKKAFLRSPLEFSRVTSGFTNSRFHPIMQTWRAHTGVDYGAPTGTRVKSTADGVVDFVGSQNGYGNTVVVRHQGTYTTVYAHLSGFAAGIRKGSRISQGDLLGYVGSTGWATGPHLHFEFRVNNVPKNPLTIALPTALPLDNQSLASFRRRIGEWNSRLALADSVRVARAE